MCRSGRGGKAYRHLHIAKKGELRAEGKPEWSSKTSLEAPLEWVLALEHLLGPPPQPLYGGVLAPEPFLEPLLECRMEPRLVVVGSFEREPYRVSKGKYM